MTPGIALVIREAEGPGGGERDQGRDGPVHPETQGDELSGAEEAPIGFEQGQVHGGPLGEETG